MTRIRATCFTTTPAKRSATECDLWYEKTLMSDIVMHNATYKDLGLLEREQIGGILKNC